MSRYLSTIPSNIGFYALGTVWSYPTGGSGPTAYGSTGYFGSTPEPPRDGDSLYTAIDLGTVSATFRTITLSNSHGGLTRRVSTFYKLKLVKPRSIQFTQNFSQFAYTENTNRNTLLSFYKLEEGSKPVELPINNAGYVYKTTGVEYDDDSETTSDYPNTSLDAGDYLFLITNDIKFIETTYSINLTVGITDWGLISESVDTALDFQLVTESADESSDFGSVST